jgi:hypothetical protein
MALTAMLIVRYGIAPAFGVATVAAVMVQAIIAACEPVSGRLGVGVRDLSKIPATIRARRGAPERRPV